MKDIFHCINSSGTVFLTLTKLQIIPFSPSLHPHLRSLTNYSAQTQWELWNLFSILKNNFSTKISKYAPHRVSSSKCCHICITPLNVASLKSGYWSYQNSAELKGKVGQVSTFGQANKEEKALLCLGKYCGIAVYQFCTCISFWDYCAFKYEQI